MNFEVELVGHPSKYSGCPAVPLNCETDVCPTQRLAKHSIKVVQDLAGVGRFSVCILSTRYLNHLVIA